MEIGLLDEIILERNREIIPVQETTFYQQELDRQRRELESQKLQIEAAIRNYEREIIVLSKEYSRLKQQGGREKTGNSDNTSICLYCDDGDKSVLFEPCRHVVCCCANCVSSFENKACPVCQVPIQSWQVVYLS